MEISLTGEIRSLFSLFTIIPVNVSERDIKDLAASFWLVPLIGAFFGLVAALSFVLLEHFVATLVAAVVAILVVSALNRFFHLDGLIDFGDGMVATGDQEKRREAMKDVRVGAGGVSFALLFTLLTITGLSSTTLFILPFAMEVAAKHGLLVTAAVGKGTEGGLGSAFVRRTEASSFLPSALITLALIFAVGVIVPSRLDVLDVGFLAVGALLASSFTGIVIASLANRCFGCVNGDVMGAANEISKGLALLVMLVVTA